MKIVKIMFKCLVVLVILIILNLTHTVVERSYSVANRGVAISTVNGGNVEFAAQEAVKTGGRLIDTGFFVLYIVTIGIGCVHIGKSIINKKTQNQSVR